MMVLGDKEARRNDRGGWREWAVGPDGIMKFGSAGVFKWLRNDLVRVLVRPATGVCSAEVAASFGDVQSSALRELMYTPNKCITSPARSSALVCSQCVCIWRGSGAGSHWPPLGLDA